MSDYAPQPQARPASASSGGIDLSTLWITAAASAAAAYACSKIWAPGTLAAAAFTPVLVAIIKEALAKSTEVVTRAVPVRGVVRSARPREPQPGADPPPPESEPLGYDAADQSAAVAQPGEIRYHGASKRARGWRVAIVTGLLGFLVCAVVFTVPELVAGGSAAGGDRGTTIFGGEKRERSEPAVTTTTTTPTQTVTAPPENTVTVPAPDVTTTEPVEPVDPPVETAPVPPTAEPPPPVEEPPIEEPPG